MSHFTFNRKRAKLKKLLGIRARLALLALIVVAPLMLDRARSLEDTRAKQIAQASQEFSELAQHTRIAFRLQPHPPRVQPRRADLGALRGGHCEDGSLSTLG